MSVQVFLIKNDGSCIERTPSTLNCHIHMFSSFPMFSEGLQIFLPESTFQAVFGDIQVTERYEWINVIHGWIYNGVKRGFLCWPYTDPNSAKFQSACGLPCSTDVKNRLLLKGHVENFFISGCHNTMSWRGGIPPSISFVHLFFSFSLLAKKKKEYSSLQPKNN